jgi:hypothetical protein
MGDIERQDKRLAALALARRIEKRTPQAQGGGAASTHDSAVARAAAETVVCRSGDGACAAANAATIRRSVRGDGASMQKTLLQLQAQYGNQFTGRVLDRLHDGKGGDDAMGQIERAINSERGNGHAIAQPVRKQMETAFGADFSAVRVHTDAKADMLSRSLSARAFATGNDIFFRQGQYNPGSSGGRELLAHELTHVVQQTGTALHRKMTVSQPDDPHEVEADKMAQTVMQMEHQASEISHGATPGMANGGYAGPAESGGAGSAESAGGVSSATGATGATVGRQPEADDEHKKK